MRHASLFSGIGGFDLAAEWMGWTNVFSCEIEEFPRKVLQHHFPNTIHYEDIKQTDFSVHKGQVDILTGGFPCQPFSTAGKRLGKEDERHLWPEMLRAIREIEPKYIVGENVRGILNWSDGLVVDEVFSDLETEGYEVLAFVLPAAGINAPHRRDRVWIIACNTSIKRQQGQGEQSIGGQERFIERGVLQRNLADTNSNGYSSCGKSEESERNWCANHGISQKRIKQTEWDNGLAGLSRIASNANSGRLERTKALGRDGLNVERKSLFGNASNTSSERCGGGYQRSEADQRAQWQMDQDERHHQDGVRGETARCGADASDTYGKMLEYGNGERETERSAHKEERTQSLNRPRGWEAFPTQPPVCGGDDGIPERLDDITFPKWRNQSIKAYGNAIVPQLAYRIFKAIELTNQKMEK